MLTAQADVVVIEAFISPGSETAIDALTTRDAAEAAMKQALFDIQADEDADVLADLEAAEDELQVRQETEEEAADAAEQARDDAQTALDDLLAAASQEVAFAADIEDRINRNLAEAAGLEETDPELAEQMRQQMGALTLQIVASRQALEEEEILEAAGVAAEDGSAGPSQIQPVSGGVVAVSCPSGGSIEVAGEIARDVQGLLNRASEQGVSICGNGYRDPSEQVELRRQNCGSSSYAIYEAPSSYCSPPTAPPGSSNHEQGLAIDFTSGGGGTIGCGGEVYDFLDENAADFGLYNLAGECWHWSTDGT
jgi:LAS superfamily LD-carboxypeptidase LdcB